MTNDQLAVIRARTWLAGLAMQGLCSRKDYEGDAPIRVAMEAIEHADALIEELNQ
jgi:hypothetical protein